MAIVRFLVYVVVVGKMSRQPDDSGSDPTTDTEMNRTGSPKGNPTGDLRRRRADVSRQAIRDAVAELLLNEHPASLSIPAVAATAGVSVRTVYRYFPTKQDLLDDVAEVQQRRADVMMSGRQDLYDHPGDYLRALWTDFERDVEAVRAQHLSPLGDKIRATRLESYRSEVRNRLDKAFPDTDQQDRHDLADLIITIMSSASFLELHGRLGRSGVDAARMAWWAARAMQKQFAVDGGMDSRPTRAGGTERQEE